MGTHPLVRAEYDSASRHRHTEPWASTGARRFSLPAPAQPNATPAGKWLE